MLTNQPTCTCNNPECRCFGCREILFYKAIDELSLAHLEMRNAGVKPEYESYVRQAKADPTYLRVRLTL